jgi:hypothetical protein
MPHSTSKSLRDNRANQLNPTHTAYYRSRGASTEDGHAQAAQRQSILNNHGNRPRHGRNGNGGAR